MPAPFRYDRRRCHETCRQLVRRPVTYPCSQRHAPQLRGAVGAVDLAGLAQLDEHLACLRGFVGGVAGRELLPDRGERDRLLVVGGERLSERARCYVDLDDGSGADRHHELIDPTPGQTFEAHGRMWRITTV